MTPRHALQDLPVSPILAEAMEVWGRMGTEIDAITGPKFTAGMEAAAACYLLPEWARETADGVPLWWMWPAESWTPGQTRRQELVLAIGLTLGALERRLPQPGLTVVDGAGSRRPRRSDIVDLVHAAHQQLLQGAPPRVEMASALSQGRKVLPAARAAEALSLAAACHLLPEQLREIGSRSGVPSLWAWPATAWTTHTAREDELVTAIALTIVLIEMVDGGIRPDLTVLPGQIESA